MGELLLIVFLGGLITGISPCIVPVIPVVMAGGSAGTSRARPYVIIVGLVVSFSLSVLFASSLLSFLHLPQDLLFWLGVAMLGLLSAGLLVPKLGEVIERPFARLGASRYATEGGGFVLGLSLGLVFVPCAGPVLTAISVAAAHHQVGATSLLVTLFYALGVTVPLLVLAVVAQRATTSWSSLRKHLPAVRQVAGIVLGLTTLAIAFNWLGALQRDVPGYTTALEDHVESTNSACSQLRQLSGEHQNQFAAANAKLEGKKATCAATDEGNSQSGHLAAGTTTTTTSPHASSASPQKPAAFMANKTNLPNLGRAPDFTGITAWFNTPGNQPLTLRQLRGKVVLIDFWTYSCINCQRALPHVEGWYEDYKKDGFVVVGVSAPEFAFEHVVSNVESAAGNLGIDYSVAVDDNLATWDAYNNQYWPADYLIDPTGVVRAYNFGEGGYDSMENNIRMLLTANGVTNLPAADRRPGQDADRRRHHPRELRRVQPLEQRGGNVSRAGQDDRLPRAVHYRIEQPCLRRRMDRPQRGGDSRVESHPWPPVHGERRLPRDEWAGNRRRVLQRPSPDDVDHRRHPQALHAVLVGSVLQTGTLTLTVSPGVEAYDFTFG